MSFEDKPKIERSYEKISPTAWGVAWRRTFTDIPYSREIFEQLQMMHSPGERDFETVTKASVLTPLQEARYKLVNKLLANSNIKQVLELAAGLAPRGLELTQDPEIVLSELDLPGIMHEKKVIVTALLGESPRPNLTLVEGSALSTVDIARATNVFQKGKEVAVVNEGLLSYLPHDEISILASNILSILKEYGGVWITPDIVFESAFKKLSNQSDELRQQRRSVSKMAGIQDEANYFKDEADARKFFEDRGFTIEKHSFSEIFDELSSPRTLSLTAESTRELIEPFMVFVMRAK